MIFKVTQKVDVVHIPVMSALGKLKRIQDRITQPKKKKREHFVLRQIEL